MYTDRFRNRLALSRSSNAVLAIDYPFLGVVFDLLQFFTDPLAVCFHAALVAESSASGRVTAETLTLCFLVEMLLRDNALVLGCDIIGHTFHTKDLNVQTLASWDCILDLCEVLFVDLVHVHRETCVVELASRRL